MARRDRGLSAVYRLPAGLCLTAGVLVLAGWAVHSPSLMALFSEGRPIAVRCAVMFVLVATAALQPIERRLARRALCGLAALTSLIDGADSLNGLGSLSISETAVVMLMLSTGLALAPAPVGTIRRRVFEGLVAVTLMIAAASLADRLLDLEAVYDWGRINRIPPQVALGLLLLAGTAWYQRREWEELPREAADPAESLVRIGTILLVAVSLLAGSTGLISMRRGIEDMLRANLLANLHNFESDFEAAIDRRLAFGRLVVTRPDLLSAVRALTASPDDAQRRQDLQTVIAGSFVGPDLKGIRILDPAGRVLATAGHIADHPAMTRELDGTGGAQLVWENQLLLDVSADLVEGEKSFGRIVIEQDLPILDRLGAQAAALGASGKGTICSLMPNDVSRMECLPDRGSAAPFEITLPQGGHVRGLFGTIDDPNGHGSRVLAGFEPIDRFHLIISMKVDTADLFAPVRERIRVALPILIGLILAGSLLLHRRVIPLARLLVEREREAQAHGSALKVSRLELDGKSRVLDVAFNNMAQGLVLYDGNHRLRAFNRQYERLIGFPPNFLRAGLSHAAVRKRSVEFGGGALEEGIALLLTLGAAEAGRQVVERRLSDGRIIEITHEPLEEGGGVLTFSDVSLARAADEVLRVAKEEAEAANRAKSEFLSMMSHEIRTPMNGVLGMIRLLLRTELQPKQWKFADTARGSAEALLAILDDILDLSKLEVRRLVLENIACDFEDLVDSVMTLSTPRAQEKAIQLRLERASDVPCWIETDGTRLRQILLNLLGNAVKFTDHGSVTLRVAARRAEQDRLILVIEIADTGIGIAPEVLPTLFTRFTQADSSISRKFGGTGLGLAIAKQLTELMGGTLSVDTVLGIGSTFRIELPCRTTAASVRSSAPEILRPMPAGRRLKILVAEDNLVNQAVTTAMLEPYRHEVMVVEDGEAAVAAVKRGDIDLVLMDIQMPKMDGLAATEAIRALGGAMAELPIVALTANAMMGQREAYLAAGMSDYLSKPLEQAELARVLQRWGAAELSTPAKAASPPLVPAAELSIVDTTRIDELVDLIPAGRLAAMLDAFFVDAEARLAELAAACDAQDLEALHRVAHDLAGMTGNYGLAETEHLARQVIIACRDGDAVTAYTVANATASAFGRAETPLRMAIGDRRPQALAKVQSA
jgi:signal transduction histidine kinase/FixJ family two-component response regulator/HPt (histidine-containing phosphotransfer) domain-containing protein